jgi:NADH:ubiquinone oxidoreductase subunit 5 (subunit L)/multisubunit Na+/H+ antiporter MnhA subunit
VAATFTAFYMFRVYYLTFWGEYRGAARAGTEATEPEHKGHDVIPADSAPPPHARSEGHRRSITHHTATRGVRTSRPPR